MNSRGLSRGVQQGAVHQGAVVSVLDQIVSLAGVTALLRLVGNPDLHGVFGVVEINDVDVKDEDGRAGNEISCSRREIEKISGQGHMGFDTPVRCTSGTHRHRLLHMPGEAER